MPSKDKFPSGPAAATPTRLRIHAKNLRLHATDAERRLWYYLRAGRFMGLKFKRQKPVGPFIVDFICLELGLILEADGGQHGIEHDRERDAWLRARGFLVLHFWNNDILENTDVVLERIWRIGVARRTALSPGPSPRDGRGE